MLGSGYYASSMSLSLVAFVEKTDYSVRASSDRESKSHFWSVWIIDGTCRTVQLLKQMSSLKFVQAFVSRCPSGPHILINLWNYVVGDFYGSSPLIFCKLLVHGDANVVISTIHFWVLYASDVCRCLWAGAVSLPLKLMSPLNILMNFPVENISWIDWHYPNDVNRFIAFIPFLSGLYTQDCWLTK